VRTRILIRRFGGARLVNLPFEFHDISPTPSMESAISRPAIVGGVGLLWLSFSSLGSQRGVVLET